MKVWCKTFKLEPLGVTLGKGVVVPAGLGEGLVVIRGRGSCTPFLDKGGHGVDLSARALHLVPAAEGLKY